MPAKNGYLLIADLSGYTAYLTSTELEHASGVIKGLLDVLVSRLGDPTHLWRLEGDAVLAYTTDPNFPDGNTFLTICEDMYNGFRERRLNMHANSTCECRACAQVLDLDLKIFVHHGEFEEMEIGPMRDISGTDAILVHRLAKTKVRESTGIKSCAVISQAAFDEMKAPKGLVPYSESIEHFGKVKMHVHDLDAVWQKLHAERERVFSRAEEGLWTHEFEVNLPPSVMWEFLVTPALRRQWQDMIDVTVSADIDRPALGAQYHCVHKLAEFTSWVVDWEPFQYLSNRFLNALHPHLSHYETYVLTANEDGTTSVRYTMGPMFDPETPDSGPFPSEDTELSTIYRDCMTPWFVDLSKKIASESRGAYS
ncbi:MAG: DUF2652 domain-containing protein [Kofleriaceae bacterium]|nr:DUF2652 domain-containing protein [Kofleriaceae bacterium]